MKLRALLARNHHWIAILSLIWAVLLSINFFDSVLAGAYNWYPSYAPIYDLLHVAPFVLCVIVYISGALMLFRQSSVWGLMVWAIAGYIALTLGAVYVRDDILYRLFTITASGQAGGWHKAAVMISDLMPTLQNWPQLMESSRSYSTHMTISPPGTVLVYYAAMSLLNHFSGLAHFLAEPLRSLGYSETLGYTDAQFASAWIGMLMPVWSSLTVLPIYFLGRRLFSDERARWGVVWWPLIPGILIFAPLPNTLYALPSLVVIWLLFEGLRINRPILVVAAGLLMSLLTFLNFTFVPLLLFAGTLTLCMYGLKRKALCLPWYWSIQMGIWFGVGLMTVWLIFYLVTGLSFFSVWTAAFHAHLGAPRPYLWFVALNMLEFYMFTGWPLALLAGVGLWQVLKRIFSKQSLAESETMILANAAALMLLDLSGALWGETGRILLFLSPWILLSAASALIEDEQAGILLTMSQGFVVVVIVICLSVLNIAIK